MKKLFATIALLSGMGVAYAGPVALTDGQMDNVSAGFYNTSEASAGGYASADYGYTNVYAQSSTYADNYYFGGDTYAQASVDAYADGYYAFASGGASASSTQGF